MASLDEVLSSMEDMGGEEDDALDFLIDENLRVISVPEQGVVLGVEGDKDVNRVRFRMNRYYHQADLSTFDIRINYQNAEGDKNYFEVSEKTATDDSLSFVWTVAADAVSYKGQVCFIVVCLKASAEGTIDKAYHTTIGKASVLEGLTVDEQVDQPKVQDLMLHLKNDLTTHATGLMENAKTEVKAAENSAKAAKESETQSATSEANALKSATAASTSAQEARTSEANAKKYSELAQVLSNGYKGWYQTEKELAADLTEAKNGDWAIIGESDTIWVWDGDTGAWVDTRKEVDLSNYLTQDQIRKLLEQYMPLRPATAAVLGGVKLSDDFTADADGTLHLAGGTAPDPYPVGIVISMVGDTSPAALFGGTWEQVASERVLMGASSTHAAGTTVKAGLPNITGSTGEFASSYSSSPDRKNGALSYSGNGSSMHYYSSSGSGGYGYYIDFNASRSNAIYGRSNTVQPAAYYVHYWQRKA